MAMLQLVAAQALLLMALDSMALRMDLMLPGKGMNPTGSGRILRWSCWLLFPLLVQREVTTSQAEAGETLAPASVFM